MKKIIFLAHDPGGYDVIFPVVQKFQQDFAPLEFYCIGPAASLNPLYGVTEAEAAARIQSLLPQKISGVVTGTSWGNDAELQVLATCKKAKVPAISVLDYWSSYQTRFIDNSGRLIYPDHYVVMDELAAKEAIQSGVTPEIIKVLGHPGLDKYIAYPRTKKHSNKKKKKKILFLSQPLSVLHGDSLGYTEQQCLEDCFRAIKGQNNCSLYVKFHPKDKVDLQKNYADSAIEGDLMEIMPRYDLIIGMNTMGLLHAVLMGIPAISYQPGLQQADMCITNKLGLTRLISSFQNLQLLLDININELAMKNKELSPKLIWLDGQSTERVAGFIREVLAK